LTDLELTRALEAVLVAADTPVTLDRLSEILGGAKRGDVKKAINSLVEHYESGEHAFTLAEIGGGWQLYARPQYSKWIKELHKGRIPARLSQAALETLAIIAYKQPIVRAEIEAIRGVDSSGVLATLLRRDVITIAGRAPGMGRALMYRTTKEFLRYFGLNSVTDLPRLEEFAEVLGLKPEELELAVEGAESVEGVREEADAPSDEELAAEELAAIRAAALPAGADPALEGVGSSGGGVSTIEPGDETEAAETQPDLALTDESPTVPTPVVPPSRLGEGAVVHPLDDRDIIDKIDEA
jgi:segregation and condensation protein B